MALSFSAGEAATVRHLASEAYEQTRARNWPFLSDVLESVLRGVDERSRGLAAAVTHAMVRYDRLLEFGCPVEAGAPVSTAARFDALIALLRGDARLDERIARIERETERLGVAYSVPDWLVDLVRDEIGPAALERALARMNDPAPRTVRVNTLKTTREAALSALAAEGLPATPTSRAVAGLLIEGDRSAFRTQAFASGEIELQDEGSQIVAELVAPPPGSRVVDACAGAGGKALALAALLRGKGKVLALDIAEAKLVELRRRARRAGASNVRGLAVDLLAPGQRLGDFEGAAARVLVDAPCTGLGAIRRNPETRWRLRPDDLRRLLDTQQELTRAAARLVAPGGRLIYAVCSFLPSEGERAFEQWLSSGEGWKPVTVRDVLGRAGSEAIATPDGRYLRTWRFDGAPDGGDQGMDGFFAGVGRRTP